jgi:hypothetical protein
MKALISGKIYHPKNLPDTLYKCIGPLKGETWNSKGDTIPLDMFILTNNFPKPHYIVIDKLTKNHLLPDQNHYLVYFITHSSFFDNLKIEKKHYLNSNLDLSDSFITRDKFLIHQNNVNDKKDFGSFDIKELIDDIEY